MSGRERWMISMSPVHWAVTYSWKATSKALTADLDTR